MLVAVLRARAVAAQEPADSDRGAPAAADQLIATGVGLRKLGRDDEALKAFEQAYTLRPSPRAAAQIALAHQARADWAEAETGLREAMAAAGDPWVIRNWTYLQASLATVDRHLGWLMVESDAPGEVWLDGRLLARLPLERPLRVPVGDLSLEVRPSMGGSLRRSVHVEAASHAYAVFTLAPRTEIRAAGATGYVGSPADLGVNRRRLASWLLAGAGVTLVAALTAQLTREAEAKEYDDDSLCGPTAALSRYQRCGANRDIGLTAQTVAIVGYAAAGAAAIAGGALLLTAPRRPTTARELRCRLGAATVVCGVAF